MRSLFLAVLAVLFPAHGAPIPTTTIGLHAAHREVGGYYNGGTDAAGNAGPNVGIVVNSGTAGSGVLDGGSTCVLSVPSGFTDGFAVGFFNAVTGFRIRIHDGENATGTQIATQDFAGASYGTQGIVFAGTAKSITLEKFAGSPGFDNLTFGSATVGTPVAEPPGVATSSAAPVTATTATLHATVNPGGAATTSQFEYGPTVAYGSTASITLSPNDGTTWQSVSATITGLAAGTLYHFRVTGTNSSGGRAGSDLTFTTPAANSPPVLAVNGGAVVHTTLVNFMGTWDANQGMYPEGSPVQGSDGSFYGMTSQGGTDEQGTVFKMTSAGVRTTLVNFTGTSGANLGSSPTGSLVQGSDGNFYGMTYRGGTDGYGTVFKMTNAGVLTTLVNFTGTSGANPGSKPYGSLVQGSDGSFYGTTGGGVLGNLGTVFKLTSAGVHTTLVNFTGTSGANPGSSPSGSLVQGSDGSFYGMTSVGGTDEQGTVFKMTSAGVLTTLVNFTGRSGGNLGSYPYGGLVQGSDGSFYGMTEQGGTGNIGTVFKLTSAGVHTTLVNFTETSGANFGGHPQGSLVEGSDRSFYGMTTYGGTGNVGTVFRMTGAGVLTTLVNFTGTSGANPGKWPVGSLVQGSDGSFYGMTSQGGAANIGTVFKLASPPVTATGAEGTPVTQSGIFSDANGPFTVRLTASVGTVFPNYGAGTWIWFHTPADGPDGPATVTITATDNGSPALVATTTVTLNVANVPPAIALSGDSTVNVGAACTLNFGTITDPGTDTVTAYSINWGDGITEPFSGNPAGLSKTHSYATAGSKTITVSLTDEDGTFSAAGTKTITVGAVAPVVAVHKSPPVRTTLVNFTGTGGANPGSDPYGSLVQGGDGSFYGMTRIGGTGDRGTVFRMTSAGVRTTLVEFTGTSGANPGLFPRGSLVQGSDGNFYGMTSKGGTGNLGTVFKMTTAGVLTTLVNFTGTSGASPGSEPWGGLVQGSDGNFYGMTSRGGTGDDGTVFRMTSAGVRTTLVNFTGTNGANLGRYPQGGLVQGSDGNFYGMTPRGGTWDFGTVFKMTSAGVRTTLVNFTGTSGANSGASPYGSLVQGSDGNFYGMTYGGGAGDLGTVFKLTSAGVRTTLVEFTGTSGANPGRSPYGSLLQGTDGSFYGMTLFGGTGDLGTVFEMTSAGVRTTLVNFTGSSGANPGRSPRSSLVQASEGSFYGMTSQGGTGGTGNLGTIFRLSAAATGAESSAVTQSGTFSDANGNATVTLTASLGTVTPDNGAGTWIWTHTPADGPDAPTTVTITATDNGSPALVGTATFSFIVTNIAPTIALTGNSTVDLGAAYTLNFGTVTDPGTDTVTAYSINWGDGITEPFSGNPTGLSRTHTYSTWGSRPITVSLTDEDGAHAASGTKTITVNRPPTFSGYTVTTPKNTAATISRAALHALAADPDGGILAISPVSAGSA